MDLLPTGASMKKHYIFLMLLFSAAYAGIVFSDSNLLTKREQVLHQYVYFMGKEDIKSIIFLFSKNAQVISSSGQVSPPITFYTRLFKELITNPKSHLITSFYSATNSNVMVLYFDFSWKNKQGEKQEAPFLDLVEFAPNSTKIKSLAVFSGRFKIETMLQLHGP